MFENITKLIKYPWSGAFLSRISKASAEIQIPESVSKDIKNGGFLMIVAYAINFLIPVLSVVLYRTSITTIISGIISFAISGGIMYAIIYYFTGDHIRKPMPYFILFILVALGLLSTIYSLLASFAFFRVFFGFGIVSIATIVIQVVAMANVAVGCIDFCLASNPE